MIDIKLNKFVFILAAPFFTLFNLGAQIAIPCGHSHNDYLQKRPLYEAIELGFGSIEIDVCLDKNNQIKVAHNAVFLSAKKSIEEMYFDPIIKMINQKDTIFKYSNEYPLTLMIDIKTNADSTYKYLKNIFYKYEKYITQYKNREIVYWAPITICISGNKPWSMMQTDTLLYAKMDGPLLLGEVGIYKNNFSDIDKEKLKLMDRASTPFKTYMAYRKYFQTDEEFILHMQVVNGEYGMLGIGSRFWAIPNNEKYWKILLLSGVRWINVDRLKKFSKFYGKFIDDLPMR